MDPLAYDSCEFWPLFPLDSMDPKADLWLSFQLKPLRPRMAMDL